MLNLFGKINEAKQKMEEVKQRLETITVVGYAAQNRVQAEATASRKIKSIHLDEEWARLEEPARLAIHIKDAVNDALQQADKVAEAEMQVVAKDLLPGMGGIPGLGGLFGK